MIRIQRGTRPGQAPIMFLITSPVRNVTGLPYVPVGFTRRGPMGQARGPSPGGSAVGPSSMKGIRMLRKLLGLAGVGALLALLLACGFGPGGDDDDDDDDFARPAAVMLVN